LDYSCEAGIALRGFVCAAYLVLEQKTKLPTWFSWLLALARWRNQAAKPLSGRFYRPARSENFSHRAGTPRGRES